jgi:hypothetical protein
MIDLAVLRAEGMLLVFSMSAVRSSLKAHSIVPCASVMREDSPLMERTCFDDSLHSDFFSAKSPMTPPNEMPDLARKMASLSSLCLSENQSITVQAYLA